MKDSEGLKSCEELETCSESNEEHSSQSRCSSMKQPEECGSEDVREDTVTETTDSFEVQQKFFSKEVQVNLAKCLKCDKYLKEKKNLTKRLQRLTTKVTRLEMVSMVVIFKPNLLCIYCISYFVQLVTVYLEFLLRTFCNKQKRYL